MRIRLIVPGAVILDAQVVRIAAEGAAGCFTLLPGHVDCVSALLPGILSCTTAAGEELVLAVDEGLLVKCGDQVSIATRQAIRGENLDSLQQAVSERILQLDSRERQARQVLSRLETSLVRGLSDGGGAA